MEQNDKLELSEINSNNNDATINDEGHRSHSHHESRSEHGSHSHHRSHSYHSSHSHHGKHHSTHHKRGKKGEKKSLLTRMQSWIDKKFGSKGIIGVCLLILLFTVCAIGLVYLFETQWKHNGIPGGDLGEQTASGENQNSNPSDAAANITVPAYWKNMIDEKTETVKALQAMGGKDCVSFVWASDTHIPDNSTAKTNDIGKLMAKMMDNCNIPFAVLTGDIGTRASYDTEAELIQAQSMLPVHLAPLWGTDRLLMALGNHDGCYGDVSCYYEKQFSPEKMWELYFRNQALDSRRVFSEDGTYFYVDNHSQKVRFIILNSQFGGTYLMDGNGIAVNNRFSTSCYGQEQLDWLADEALDMPEGYGAIITSHVPVNVTYTVDKDQLIGIINAYCNKTTYSGSYTAGIDGWTNSSVSVDFTEAKGEIIAVFTGHIHQDTVDTTTLACPLITIISAGAQVNAGEMPDRTFGTDTETSFDVVTINRKTRTIYCTRVGAGEDRVIRY